MALGIFEGTTYDSAIGAQLDAGRDGKVGANWFEDLTVMAGTAAAGAGGLAGTVSVMVTTSDTQAWIGSFGSTHADIDAARNVEVEANSRTDVNQQPGLRPEGVGAAAIGGVAVGASVDVITINNTTAAYVNDNSAVNAGDSVKIIADADRNLASTVIAFSGGAGLSVSGAVSVISVGAGVSGKGNDAAGGAQTSIDAVLSGSTDGYDASSRYTQTGTKNLIEGDTVDANDGMRYRYTGDDKPGVNLAGISYSTADDWSVQGASRNFTGEAYYLSSQASASVAVNQTVDVVTGYSGSSAEIGNRYEYIGASTLAVSDWSSVDFTDDSQWLNLGKSQKFLDRSKDADADRTSNMVARGSSAANGQMFTHDLDQAASVSGTSAFIGA